MKKVLARRFLSSLDATKTSRRKEVAKAIWKLLPVNSPPKKKVVRHPLQDSSALKSIEVSSFLSS